MLEIYQIIHSHQMGVARDLQRLCVVLIELNLTTPFSDLLYITHFPNNKTQDSLTSDNSYDEFILM